MPFSGVFVFGDSLVDPGNDLRAAEFLNSFPFASLPNGAPTADKGYFEGRFTDGFNFADLVSNKLLLHPTEPTFPFGLSNALLGVSLPTVSRPEGDNLSFAYGGAQALQGLDPAPGLHAQTTIYGTFTPDPNAVYVVSIGANDVLSLVPTGGGVTTGAAANAKLVAVAAEISQEVAQLYARGVRHVVVANVPDVGVTPAFTGAQDEAMRRALATQYTQTVDNLLKTDLAAVPLPAGATLNTFDFLAYTDAVTANPAAYGFTNVTQALTSVQAGAPDPAGGGFLFFDKLHPTAEAHAQIAAAILNDLQNPGAPLHWTMAPAIGSQAFSALAQGGVGAFSASLVGGQSYVVDALGVSSASGTLSDPTVRVLDSAGAVVAQADDGGLGLDAHLQFTAPSSGAFTVQVAGVGVSQGTYRLQAGDAGGSNLLLTGQLRGSDVGVEGGAGNDTIAAVAGANVLFGGAGDDSITGGSGFNAVNGNMGDDTIVGVSALGDRLLGGQGDDSITATQSSGHNLINGNLGDDAIVGGSGGDTLRGGQGDDQITGGSGPDLLFGDLGNNTLTGGAGADVFHAGHGLDRVTDFSVAQGDRVELDPGVTFTLTQMGPDAVVDVSGGGQMILMGVQDTTLPTGWIFTA